MNYVNKYVLTLVVLVNAGIGIFAQTNFKLLETNSDHNSPIESLTMAPDGTTMITGHHDGYLVFWDLKTRKITKELKVHSNQINTILFEPTGKQFVTAGEDGKVALIEYPSLKIIKTYSVPSESNAFAVLSPDGSAIYFGGHSTTSRTMDYTKNVYNKPLGALYRINIKVGDKAEIAFNDERPNEYGSWITDGAIDYSGKYLIFPKNGLLFFYNVNDKRLEYKVDLPYGLNNLTSTKDALYVWGDMQLMKLGNSGGRYSLLKTVKAGTRPSTVGYSKMVMSANGNMLVTGDDGNDVNIWNKDLEKLQTISGHTDLVRNFLFYNNDSILVTAGYDGKIMYWGYEAPKDTTPVITDVVFTENNVPVSIKDRAVELQSTITVSEPEFDIEIWDRSVVDGDSISLNLNGEWILQEYMVVKTKLKLHVKVNPNASNNYLILFAHNLGEISPNTAAVQVLIGDKEYKLTLTSDLKKSGALNFSYVPK
jgi:WD40 repeat protein